MVQRTTISLNIGHTTTKMSERGTSHSTPCTNLRVITLILPRESTSQTRKGLRCRTIIRKYSTVYKCGEVSQIAITKQDEMPPDYLLERRHVSKAMRRDENRYFRKLRRVRNICSFIQIPNLCMFYRLRGSTGMGGWIRAAH